MTLSDANDLFAMHHHPKSHLYTDTLPYAKLEDTFSYIDKMNQGILENKWIIWAIELKQTH